jgi:N-6 DNA Methylase
MKQQKEFGDFQTPRHLANAVVALVSELCDRPDLVIEPTAGLGTFLQAAHSLWGDKCCYEGYEINADYVALAQKKLAKTGASIVQQDFFGMDWSSVLQRDSGSKVLVIGNPPWVTNAELGRMNSGNLPQKSNFQGLRGLDARMGKSNFDIAEWMLIQLIQALPESGAIAVLCKTITARKVLRYFWKMDVGFESSKLFIIDAKASFDVAVDACLFFATGKRTDVRSASVYPNLSLSSQRTDFGWVAGQLVSDVKAYHELQSIDGTCCYTWRSGIKHDAAKIMELSPCDQGQWMNGLGEIVELESEFLYPLLKSSDLGNGKCLPRKSVLVTQKNTSQDTRYIADRAPKTWQYLQSHAEHFNSRKSSIYRNRPQYCVFGVGDYSFSSWKVAISGLYKTFRFVVIPPVNYRPVMVDDTCYAITCRGEQEANLICDLLNSDIAQRFLASLVFEDSKRPITIDVLRRISLLMVAQQVGKFDEILEFVSPKSWILQDQMQQMTLL